MADIGFLLGIALLGLVIGSLLTTIIMRVPYGKPLATGPRCPVCEHPVAVRDQIPLLSWLALRGRCRACRATLGWRYPTVEILTAVLFAAITWRVGLSWHLPAYLYLVAVGVALAVIDIDVHRLPDLLTLPSYAALAALFGLACVVSGQWGALGRAFTCGIALFVAYYLVALAAPSGMGFGDVKFAGVLGIALGFAGWSVAVTGTLLGFVFGGVVSAVLLIFGWIKRHTRIAFGPFMFAGALAALLIGDEQARAALGVTFGG